MEIRIVRLIGEPIILNCQLGRNPPEMDPTNKHNLPAHEALCDSVS